MRKLFVNLIGLFIPFPKLRRRIRAFLKTKYCGRGISRPYIPPRKTYKRIVSNIGSGHSGSGTILDFLTEFDNCTSFGYHSPNGGGRLSHTLARKPQDEMDFLRHTGGIFHLESVFENNNPYIRSDTIKMFISLYEFLYKNSPYEIYNDEFLRLSREFVDDLTAIRIPMTEFNGRFLYQGTPPQSDGLEHPFWTWPGRTMHKYVLKNLTRKEYRAIAKNFLNKFLSTIESQDIMFLDHFTNDRNINIAEKMEYFDDMRIIGVWRDPRDIFATVILLNVQFIPRTPSEFIEYYRQNTSPILEMSHPNYISLRFEDFVLNYDAVAPKVMDFLGLSEKNHIHRRGFFDPDVSRKNIGLYKNIENQAAIKQIEKELSEYIYKGNSEWL
ncbi:MAG: hypothetical protein LBD94_03235 [Rickettsiales bacterium]|nr:hypothetical protein [Rickettsiales bacterium]